MQSPTRFKIRNIQIQDASAIQSIQSACYPIELQETIEVLLAKSRLSPTSCWLAANERGILGYLFTHPWNDELPPELNSPLDTLPDMADTLFLHDLAIHPQARGLGIAQALLNHAHHWASSYRLQRAMLVAVRNSQGFWQRHGFKPVLTQSSHLNAKLRAYGPGSCCLAVNMQDWRASCGASC